MAGPETPFSPWDREPTRAPTGGKGYSLNRPHLQNTSLQCGGNTDEDLKKRILWGETTKLLHLLKNRKEISQYYLGDKNRPSLVLSSEEARHQLEVLRHTNPDWWRRYERCTQLFGAASEESVRYAAVAEKFGKIKSVNNFSLEDLAVIRRRAESELSECLVGDVLSAAFQVLGKGANAESFGEIAKTHPADDYLEGVDFLAKLRKVPYGQNEKGEESAFLYFGIDVTGGDLSEKMEDFPYRLAKGGVTMNPRLVKDPSCFTNRPVLFAYVPVREIAAPLFHMLTEYFQKGEHRKADFIVLLIAAKLLLQAKGNAHLLAEHPTTKKKGLEESYQSCQRALEHLCLEAKKRLLMMGKKEGAPLFSKQARESVGAVLRRWDNLLETNYQKLFRF